MNVVSCCVGLKNNIWRFSFFCEFDWNISYLIFGIGNNADFVYHNTIFIWPTIFF